jgi:hypothetical protein
MSAAIRNKGEFDQTQPNSSSIISGRDGSKPKDKIGRADRSQEFHHLGSALQHNGNMHLIKRSGREGERNEQKNKSLSKS